MAIQSFGDKVAAHFFETGKLAKGAKWASVRDEARRKLDALHFAGQLVDLRAPPGNRLEALKGDLLGFYSVRINRQWRVVFRWTETGPADVRICDYH